MLFQLQNLTLFQYHNLDFSPSYILTLNKRKKIGYRVVLTL